MTFFNSTHIENIGKRYALGGFDGVRFAKEVSRYQTTHDYAPTEPVFGSKIFNTMEPSDRQQFEEETMQRGAFLEKTRIAGKKTVDTYEDQSEELAFNPLKDAQYAGQNSYDSGLLQSHSTKEDFMKVGVTRDIADVSVDKPDPYRTTLHNKIYIKQ